MRLTLLSLALAFPLSLAFDGPASRGQEPRPRQDPTERPQERPRDQDGDKPAEKLPEERDDVDIFGRPKDRLARGDFGKSLLGCWQMIDARLNGVPAQGRTGSGILLIHEGFLAFELHMNWPRTAARLDVHQTFIAEYKLTPDRVLEVSTLIGSFLDDRTAELEWERSGFARRYEVFLSGSELILTYDKTNQLIFTRMRPTRTKQRDIFGREVEADAETETDTDIFGRPARRKEGDRD